MTRLSDAGSVPTGTGSRPRKLSWQKLADEIQSGKRWPFEKADPALLEMIERASKKKDFAALPEAPY